MQIAMNKEFYFNIKSIRFDEDYQPSENTRITTNFANLARGANRQENLRNALKMIDNRFNALAHWDNPKGDRYSVEIEIISVEMKLNGDGNQNAFPLIEILKTNIIDRVTNERIEGIVGNNFSSMCVITISALYCRNITAIRLRSASLPVLVICMAIFSSIL
jgi:hypothetical protein